MDGDCAHNRSWACWPVGVWAATGRLHAWHSADIDARLAGAACSVQGLHAGQSTRHDVDGLHGFATGSRVSVLHARSGGCKVWDTPVVTQASAHIRLVQTEQLCASLLNTARRGPTSVVNMTSGRKRSTMSKASPEPCQMRTKPIQRVVTSAGAQAAVVAR